MVNRQNWVGDSSKHGVLRYPLLTGYVTQPNFARQNRLTVVMRISDLPLIFIAAPWEFYTDRQNHFMNWPKIGNKTANINVKKTAVYTDDNDDIHVVTHRKQQKSKKVIYNTLRFGNVLLGNIIFFDFCCFRCVTHYVVVNICIKLQFYISAYTPLKLDIQVCIARCSAALSIMRRCASLCSDLHLSPAMFQSRLSRTTL